MNRRQDIATTKYIEIGEAEIMIDQIIEVARGAAKVRISDDQVFVKRMNNSVKALGKAIKAGEHIYGVTTGYGSSCGNWVEQSEIEELGRNLIRYHGCGTGDLLGIPQVRAGMLCRMICLAKGYSGVSLDLLGALADFLNHGLTPCVPSEGSVGASGDLTPMSYIAAALSGEREVFFQGERMPAAEALEKAGLDPYSFKPKEPLAMLNGTSIMTGIAAIVVEQSRYILDAAAKATALCLHGLSGHAHHFHQTLFAAKPFSGQEKIAAQIRDLLKSESSPPESVDPNTFQDPYSIRCTPHVLGVLADSLDWIVDWIETEANSSNDNPLIDLQTGQLLMGCNFYGGHIALAMDSIKITLANVADLCDRQIALLVDPRFSRGLPMNLVNGPGTNRKIHHGFKAAQITASSITAEALRESAPASIFSRSTESHNQDKVSLGTIAAKNAATINTLVSKVIAVQLLCGAQACRLRGSINKRPALVPVLAAIESISLPNDSDRPMGTDIEKTAWAILDGTFADESDAS